MDEHLCKKGKDSVKGQGWVEVQEKLVRKRVDLRGPRIALAGIGLFSMRSAFRSIEAEAEKKPCLAPISRLRVEKIEGGLVVAGVVVAANCQLALSVFGCLFVLVGIVLTVASYRGPGQDEEPENYAARLAFTGNSRILGPACIAVGFIMLSAGIFLCHLAKKARRRERRVGFHCPIHGNFYPLSPVNGCKTSSIWGLCFSRTKSLASEQISHSLPQCPHTQLSSTRSSLSGPVSPCPTPMPFLVTSNSVGSDLVISVGGNLSPDQTFGSIRSLSVCREIASFPLSRTPSPPHQEMSCSVSGETTEKKRVDLKIQQPGEQETRMGLDGDEDTVLMVTARLTELPLLTTAQTNSPQECNLEKHSVLNTARKSVSVVVPLENSQGQEWFCQSAS